MKTVIKIWLAVLLVAIITITYINYAIADITDKYDGGCTGLETAGRCSDHTPTGCPYGDSVTIGPECDKLAPAPQVQPAPVETNTIQPANNENWGK